MSEKTIQDLKRIMSELVAKKEEIEKHIVNLRELMKLFRHKESAASKREAHAEREAQQPSSSSTLQLHGLNRAQALVKIAKANNGILNLREAKRLLVAAGVLPNDKKASQRVHGAASRSGLFQKIGRGKFRLIQNGGGIKDAGLQLSGLAGAFDASAINPKVV